MTEDGLRTEDGMRQGAVSVLWSSRWQMLAMVFCLALGMAMIVNTQWGGEAMWFWYGTLFHNGAKLYSQLHVALQPLYVMETSAWMTLLGNKNIPYEIPSIVHVLVLSFGLFLVLRESTWPDWQKAIVLAGAFVLTVVGSSYRFDDYHVVAECLILYTAVLLLMLARAESERRQFVLASAIGLLCGLTVVTRLTDGAALSLASGLSVLVLARRRKIATAAVVTVVALAAALIVIRMTGDTYADYVSNSIIKAAGSKGGTGSIFAAPVLFFHNAVRTMMVEGKGILLAVLLLFGSGAVVQRYWKAGLKYLVPLQLGVVALGVAVSSHAMKQQLLAGTLIPVLTIFVTVLTYVLAPVVTVRFGMWAMGKLPGWDVREILLLVPLGEWASYSAGAGGEAHTGYYAPVAMLLLFVAALGLFRRQASWANASFVTVLALAAISGTLWKVQKPYAWQNYRAGAMFEDRQWYQHPLYGTMYIDNDQLHFIAPVCAEIGTTKTELLSLPYPFPNYFCGIAPWHGYVQTFFDTSTRETINHLMQELETAPPQWIVYQRQLKIMSGSEMLYNHGQPIAQRDLDAMILRKIAEGKWTLVDKRDYLEGDGWYVIRTR